MCSGDCHTTACPDWDNPTTFNGLHNVDIKKNPPNWQIGNVSTESCYKARFADFIDALKFFSDEYGPSGMNTLEWIGTVGAGVCTDPRRYSCHNTGRAFDLSKAVWNNIGVNPIDRDWDDSNRTIRRRYLALEACGHRFFGETLGGNYGNIVGDSHVTHIHLGDPWPAVLNKDDDADASFIQAVCNDFNGANIPVNGVWTTATQTAWGNLNDAWNFNQGGCQVFEDHSATAIWCNHVMANGFADTNANNNVYNDTSGC